MRYVHTAFWSVFFVFLGVFLWSFETCASLFVPTEEDAPLYGDGELLPPGYDLPAYAVDDNGDVLPSTVSPSTVSTGDAAPVTYADVEAIVDTALATTYSVNVSVADAYLSAAIVEVFSRVVDGLPVGTHYAAYRNSSDSNEGYLVYSQSATVSGSRLFFPAGSSLVHYYRRSYQSGYQTYYDYLYDVSALSADYTISYGAGQLIYTDLVEGYPVLADVPDSRFAAYAVVAFVVIGVLFILFRRR